MTQKGYKQKKPSNALNSLIGIALTLPGISPAQAQQTISTSPKAEAFYSSYSENKNRYKIDTYQTSILFPVSSQWEVGLGALRDIMTGASISGYLPNIIFRPFSNYDFTIIPDTSVDPNYLLAEVKTRQSIIENRSQINMFANYYLPEGLVGLEAGYSTENDFESFFGNVNTEWYFNKKNTTLYAGFGYQYNISRPGFTAGEVFSIAFSPNFTSNRGTYHRESFALGIKQDINKNFYVQQNAELILDNGNLNDPYKLIAFFGPNVLNWPNAVQQGNFFVGTDSRPRSRVTVAFVTSLVKYIPCFESALHFSYRYAQNSWGIHSNTFEVGYYQPFYKSWEIAPKVRYYTQDRASFYALSFHTEPSPLFLHSKELRKNRASSDYRLANFGSLGFDVTLTKSFQNPNIILSSTFGFTKRATNLGWTKNKGPQNPSNQFHQKYVAVQLSSDFPQKLSYKKKETCNNIYKEGDISIQPLNVHFTGITFGRKHEDTKFVSSTPYFYNRATKNMYRNQRGYGFNDIHSNGLGYDVQLGYFLKNNIEVFADLGFVNEKGLKQPTVIIENAFKFKHRTSYKTNLGARYYFNTTTIFTPFLGIMVGNIWQPKTKGTVYGMNPFDVFTNSFPDKLGTFTAFRSANVFNGALLAGLDYRFDETFAVSFATGLYYYQRNKPKKLTVPASPLGSPANTYKFSDHRNKFVVPLSISLKIIM